MFKNSKKIRARSTRDHVIVNFVFVSGERQKNGKEKKGERQKKGKEKRTGKIKERVYEGKGNSTKTFEMNDDQ